MGYVEAVVKIPWISQYCECVTMLVLPTIPYSAMVLVQIDTSVIERAMQKITEAKLAKACDTC